MVMKSLALTAVDHAATNSVCAVAFFSVEVDRTRVSGLVSSSFPGKLLQSEL